MYAIKSRNFFYSCTREFSCLQCMSGCWCPRVLSVHQVQGCEGSLFGFLLVRIFILWHLWSGHSIVSCSTTAVQLISSGQCGCIAWRLSIGGFVACCGLDLVYDLFYGHFVNHVGTVHGCFNLSNKCACKFGSQALDAVKELTFLSSADVHVVPLLLLVGGHTHLSQLGSWNSDQPTQTGFFDPCLKAYPLA